VEHGGGSVRPLNLAGKFGSYSADCCSRRLVWPPSFFPLLSFALGWKWLRSEPIERPRQNAAGASLLTVSASASCSHLALL